MFKENAYFLGFKRISNRIKNIGFLILAKRLSEEQKKQLAEYFKEGKTIDDLANRFNFTKTTILRNLKKYFGDNNFKNLFSKNQSEKKTFDKQENNFDNDINNKNFSEPKNINETYEEDYFSSSFMEIAPLNCEIDNSPQKDLSSLPISNVDLPKTVYIVVDKKTELQIKYLKEYPDWQFLSNDELNRRTIEIHEDLKIAKRVCNKDQKVIKVPNTEVFKIAAPFLLSRGISRIVNADQLIAL